MLRTSEFLNELQSYPLEIKEKLTMQRIRELAREYPFYVSFSGGKDSEVAVHFTAKTLKRLGHDKMHVVQIMTGLEYNSVTQFVKPFCDRVSQEVGINVILDVVYPKKNFIQVLQEEGYPLVSKEVSLCIYEARKGLENGNGTYSYRLDALQGQKRRKDGTLSTFQMDKYRFLLDAPFRISHHCCTYTKKQPAIEYEKRTGRIPLVGTQADESRLRKSQWLRHGCNAFDQKRPKSAPFSFWRQNDILEYLYKNKLPVAGAYGQILPIRGNMVGQGSIFELLGEDSPCQYCTTGCNRTGCLYCLFGILSDRNRILRLQKIEPHRTNFVLRGGAFDRDGYWVPTKEGLGYAFILDWLKEQGYEIPYEKEVA